MIIYSKPDCPRCETLKGQVSEYEEINVMEDPQAREKLVQAGFRMLPVVELDGE